MRQDAAMGYQQDDKLEILDQLPGGRPWMISMPNSTFSRCWELTSVLLLVYITVVMPIRMGFDMRDDATLFVVVKGPAICHELCTIYSVLFCSVDSCE